MNYPYYNQAPMQNNINGNNSAQNGQMPSQMSQMPAQMNYNQMSNQQTLFPSPIGNVYSLNTASDIGNVPAGTSMSLGLCLSENILYIKALQNGSPMLLGYRLAPLEGVSNTQQDKFEPDEEIYQRLEELNDRFKELEEQVGKIKTKLGGKNEWPL